jgi:hypothetical protein
MTDAGQDRAGNIALRSARQSRGWTQEDFAEQFWAAAQRRGLRLSLSVRQVRRWESTDPPWPQAPYRTVLEDLFGVPTTELGFTPTPFLHTDKTDGRPEAGTAEPSDAGLAYSGSMADTLRAVSELGRADVQRRSFLTNATFVAAALAAPSRDWLLASLESQQSGRRRRISPEHVAAIRDAFARFQQMDVIGGGGDDVRRLVATYLAEHVMPIVSEPQHPSVQAALFEVASEQTYLAGWMAYDSGRHGLAQRYLIQSLRLAQASGNQVLGAHVLAGMADQATQQGHPAEGLGLARAGRHGLRGLTAPAALTDLWVLEARAHAAMGDVISTVHAIDAAERTYDRIDTAEEPEWARFIDEAYVTGEIANSLRDVRDAGNADRFATQSVAACRRQNRNRRASLSYAVLATSHVQRGDLEAAAHAATQSLTMADGVPSIRCTASLNKIRMQLAPHRGNSAVDGFLAHSGSAHRP